MDLIKTANEIKEIHIISNRYRWRDINSKDKKMQVIGEKDFNSHKVDGWNSVGNIGNVNCTTRKLVIDGNQNSATSGNTQMFILSITAKDAIVVRK